MGMPSVKRRRGHVRPIIWVFKLIQNFPVPGLTDRWKNTERAGPAAKLPMGGSVCRSGYKKVTMTVIMQRLVTGFMLRALFLRT